MKALNYEASRIMQEVGVNACTDITGFGLIGHAMEMAEASSASIMFNIKNIPFFPKAIDLVKKSANHPKTIKSNREYLASNLRMPDDIKPEQANLLYDPQTSGGLLISVSPEKSQKLVEQLSAAKILAAIVGEVVEKGGVAILVKD